ncbi:hypothetical protein AKJ08_1734 [Vulgatibacter incomptus]|uniref:Uncharacterized protein n=1 Tax=Vulgatibacter incomptus TaxID=1391653 RepID=A0A0K1PCW8_9BACT|nr:hypothetical protein AKJ08_1734 [Vulgatibacter incomptus]
MRGAQGVYHASHPDRVVVVLDRSPRGRRAGPRRSCDGFSREFSDLPDFFPGGLIPGAHFAKLPRPRSNEG